MLILKCKNCGALLPEIPSSGMVTCEYCGLEQSAPLEEMQILQLFERADHQRRFQQYDEAMETYQNILKIRPDSAEAYWGLCLCRYGVEFVTDPVKQTVFPTCNRMQRELITADTDFQSAISCAGALVKDHYRQIGDYLAFVQKNYFSLKEKEKPYDIFICYKDSNPDGSRTRDSLHAEVLYDELTAQGYRVFFSRRTLQEMAGERYEGYIYLALTSARVMLLVSSSADYVESPWLKNEWSRYLYQISKDPSKKMILVYRDLDPSSLDSRLALLQGIDMKRWDFRGVLRSNLESIFAVKTQPAKEGSDEDDSEYEELLEKAEKALAEGNYEEAEKGFDEALNYDPENAGLYWKLFLAKEKGKRILSSEEEPPVELKLAFHFSDENSREEFELSDVQREHFYRLWQVEAKKLASAGQMQPAQNALWKEYTRWAAELSG